MKKLCMTKLFGGPQLDRFFQIREQETLKLLKSLVDKSREGKPCDIGEELSVFASAIICRMVIGNICVENPNLPIEISKLVGDIMENAAKFSFNEVFGPLNRFDLLGKGKRLVSATRKYDELLEQLMKKYDDNFDNLINSRDEEQNDLMFILMETYKDTNAELKLTRTHIKKFFLEMFFAGVETTATAMQSAITELINNPSAFMKLREEIHSVVGSNYRLLKESDVPKLRFLQAVVKETVRLNPSYSNLAGKAMRHSDSWEKPDDFFPERFLADSMDNNSDHHPTMDFKGDHDFRFLPFGSGRRACIGASHGLIVTHATIGALVQCFDWEVKDDAKIENELETGPIIVRDCTISGYKIPAKTRLFLDIWSLGMDPNHWENPLEFWPQRVAVKLHTTRVTREDWSGNSNMIDVRGRHFHRIPFGTGRRSCPGHGEGPGRTLPRAHSLVRIPVSRPSPFRPLDIEL
ncbi:hypothetical protein DKX38_023779 [Salix brachista]|uniref:Cytochrome P450 n=1 Tax=Salix brachista TaxID=2182728 RepID=A0A5N5JPW1_9ROSI|nr:hypothetical protein DKX38_023779 [Salix brachista]